MPIGCFRNGLSKHKDTLSCKPGGESDDPTATDTVKLSRTSDDDLIGLVFAGGADLGTRPHVTNLRSGSLAALSDRLMVGDVILSINGISVDRLTQAEITLMLKHARSQSVFDRKCMKTCVTLHKTGADDSLGLTIRGGVNRERVKSRPITVTSIRKGTSTHREGTMKVGDRVVAIQGVNMISGCLDDGRRLLEQHNPVSIIIEYDIAIMETVETARTPLLVELGHGTGSDLGIALCNIDTLNGTVAYIEYIRPASIAHRCGALHVGDQILAVDGITVSSPASFKQVQETLQGVGDRGPIQIEILPVNAQPPSDRLHFPQRVSREPVSEPAGGLAPTGHAFSFYSVFSEDTATQAPGDLHLNSFNSSVSCFTGSSRSIHTHEDFIDINLIANRRGIGIKITEIKLDVIYEPISILSVEAHSSADRCGLVQEGDRIVSINCHDIVSMRYTELTASLDSKRCRIRTAFDVADASVLAGGTYVVKLYKRAGSVGITLKSRKGEQEVGIVISEVKPGSPAHRCGAISVGDELVSIDSIDVSKLTTEEAEQVIHNSDTLVSLTVKKVASLADQPLVFTVQIPRGSEPLGLIIKGAEGGSDPIVVSQILKDGITDRIGAVMLGDRILAINGKPLRGKTLGYATQLLQATTQVSLTISRTIGGQHGQDKGKNGHNTDSALESWESESVSPASKKDPRSTSTGSRKSSNHQTTKLSQVTPTSRSANKHVSSGSQSGPGNRVARSSGDQHSSGGQRSAEGPAYAPRITRRPSQPGEWSVIVDELSSYGKMGIRQVLEDSIRNSQKKPSASSPHFDHPAPSPDIRNHGRQGSIRQVTLVLSGRDVADASFGFAVSPDEPGKGCRICAVEENSAASRAGLLENDRIVQVNGISVIDLSAYEIIPLIGERSEMLTLAVERSAPHVSTLTSIQDSDNEHGFTV